MRSDLSTVYNFVHLTIRRMSLNWNWCRKYLRGCWEFDDLKWGWAGSLFYGAYEAEWRTYRDLYMLKAQWSQDSHRKCVYDNKLLLNLSCYPFLIACSNYNVLVYPICCDASPVNPVLIFNLSFYFLLFSSKTSQNVKPCFTCVFFYIICHPCLVAFSSYHLKKNKTTRFVVVTH